MEWQKKGLIYCPDASIEWMNNSVLTPQPFLLDEDTIRIYASFRDKKGIGRIGFIDLDARNPSQIINISEDPVLDIGSPGCFDDNGMILGDVIRVNDKIYMYYVAFQLVEKVKFLAFSGLAISRDNGLSFSRIQNTPVLDRSDEGVFGRCIHSVIYDGSKFKVYYTVIHDWVYINNIPYPAYYIKYIESDDGINFGKVGRTCITCNSNEYRIGRPKVRKLSENLHEMYFTYDTFQKEYKTGYAISSDEKNWVRRDSDAWLVPSKSGFDDKMACYPVVIETKYGIYMFYDGNDMGKTGFGYAELVKKDI